MFNLTEINPRQLAIARQNNSLTIEKITAGASHAGSIRFDDPRDIIREGVPGLPRFIQLIVFCVAEVLMAMTLCTCSRGFSRRVWEPDFEDPVASRNTLRSEACCT